MDENYEWDAEFALESDILEALQLYRSGAPARPVSTIALRDLERQSECGTPGLPPTLPRARHLERGGGRTLWHPRPWGGLGGQAMQRGRTLPVSSQSPAAAPRR